MLFAAVTLFAAVSAAAAEEPTTVPILDAPTLTAACKQTIADSRNLTKELAAIPIGSVTPDFLARWDDHSILMQNVSGPVGVLTNMHPDKRVRDAGEDCESKISARMTEIYQDEDLYRRIKAVVPANPIQARLQKILMEGFEDSGVTLPADKRARFKEIAARMSELSQEYLRNIRDNPATLTFSLAEVEGLPASAIDRMKDGKGNVVVRMTAPDLFGVLTTVRNENVRKRVQLAFETMGTHRNVEILDLLAALRKESAALHGDPSYAHYATRRRMSGSPDVVNDFLTRVAKPIREVENREIEEMRALKARTLGTPVASTSFGAWDVKFWREKLRQTRYAIDQEEMRKYFPVEATQRWLIDVTERVYGLRIEQTAAPVWHPDVRYMVVKDAKSGALLGGIYLDLISRSGKYAGGAAFTARGASGRTGRRPISVLVMNFESYGLTPRNIQTLFHEFGHAMHNVLSETYYVDHSGTNVESDFVEAPSTIYEEWFFDAGALALMKKHCPACPVIDASMVERLRAAQRFGEGLLNGEVLLFSEFDMALVSARPRKTLEAWKQLSAAAPTGYFEGSESPALLSHWVWGYAAGYYGYLWAAAIGHDMLSVWKGNLLDPEAGMRMRKKVLARGGELPANELLRDFLGRPVSNEAFFRYLANATTP